MQKIILKIILAFILFYNLHYGVCGLFAQDDQELVVLTKQVMEAKTSHEARPALEKLKKLYFQKNKYDEFIDFLKSLERQKKDLGAAINFYSGLTRYHQLGYLEEAQDWNEYFSKGNTYRQEIEASLGKVVAELEASDIFSIYAKLILWKFHSHEQDALSESALDQLLASALACAQKCASPLPIKQVADELSSAGEKAKSRQLYKAYVEKISSSDVASQDLKDSARGFYDEKNLELAQALYDAYLERIIASGPKDKAAAELVEIGKLFLAEEGRNRDIFYAEKIFKKIESLGVGGIFDEELTYARAFNLEKARDFTQAKDVYVDLSKRFPDSLHYGEAVFKVAMIYTYVLRDMEKGRAYFTELARKESVTTEVISSLYQLGLLAQWQEDPAAAKDYYDRLLDKAGGNFSDRTALTKIRLKEIAEAKPLEYNLKKFLDVSLEKENFLFDMSKIDLRSSNFKLNTKQAAKVSAASSLPESGCMEVTLEYLWSGNLNVKAISSDKPAFEVSYPSQGTREINLVVVSSSGVVDRSMIFLDVY